jgi:type I restriction enzyme S subunit
LIDKGIGGGQPNISQGILKDLKIPVPPLPIQQQIVSELDTLNDIISKKKQQLVDLNKLVQATFYDMFGDLHSNPNNFEVKTFNEIFSLITDGTHQTPTYTDDNINGFKFLGIGG